MSEVVPQWYADYLAVEQATVFAVLLGANYMNITELVHLACATIASWAKCKTPQEIMQTFGITEDFTEEEILQRFARGDESRTGEGSGLGLSIAESFTQSCGGTFKLDIDGDQFKVNVEFPTVEVTGRME